VDKTPKHICAEQMVWIVSETRIQIFINHKKNCVPGSNVCIGLKATKRSLNRRNRTSICLNWNLSWSEGFWKIMITSIQNGGKI